MEAMREADLEQLYERLERAVYNVVYRWVWNEDDAQEIVQEAFVRLWRMRERVQMGSVEPLIYRIAMNLAASRLRTRKVWRWVSLELIRGAATPEAATDQRLIRDERQQRLRAAIEALPEDLRRIILLTEFSEMTYDQVATALSIPPGTVASRRNRAVRRLREALRGPSTPDARALDQPV